MPDNKKKKESAYASLRGFHRAVPIIIFAVAIFFSLCFVTQNTGRMGIAISGFFLGAFSIGAYFIPPLLMLHAMFYPTDIKNKNRLISRAIFSLVLLIAISSLTHAISNYGTEPYFSASDFYNNGKVNVGGGFVGGAVSFAIISVVGYVGLIILTLTVVAIYITYFFAGEKNVLRQALSRALYRFVSACARIEKRIKDRKKEKNVDRALRDAESERRLREKNEKKETKRAEALMAKEEELYDDDFFAVDNGLKELKIAELGINEHRRDEDIERNPTLQERVHPKAKAEDYGYTEEKTSQGAPKSASADDVRRVNTDYGINSDGDIVIDSAPRSEQRYGAASHGVVSDRADSVFTDDFNPYSLEENERLANKPSSRTGYSRRDEGVTEIRRPEPTQKSFSESEIEAARRRANFEMRKEALIKEREAFSMTREQPAPTVSESFAEPAPKASEPLTEPIERNIEGEATGEERAFRINSAAEAMDRTKAEIPYSPIKEYTAPEAKADYRESARAEFSEPEQEPAYEPYRSAASESGYEDTLKITRTLVTDTDEPEEEEKSDETLCVFTEVENEHAGEEFLAPDEPDEDEERAEVNTVFEFDGDDDEDEDAPLEEIAPENQNPDVLKYREMYSFFKEPTEYTEQTEATPKEEPEEERGSYPLPFAIGDSDYDETESDEEAEIPSDEEDEDDIPFDDYMPIHAPEPPVKKQAPEKPAAEKPDYSAFKFPPIDLLAKGKDSEDPSIELEIQENGEKLIDALAQFNVRASVRSVDRGPRITRYEIVPARGVRVNSVISLFDDIALNLAAEGIRMEAPIPGKSAIGVEIPNKHPTTVMLRDLLETEEFKNESSKTFSCVGKDVTGNPVFGDMSKMPHILVAGATGMGKSVCINSILISILYKARPDEVKFIMIDPKTVEFTMYNGIPHLLVPVVTDVKQAAGALMWAIDEMNRRYELMAKHEVRKLDSYNDIVRADPSLGEPLPKIIIVIDELNDLMQQVRKPVEGLITNITQKARAAGIHMIIGTQRPSVDVITGVIKANVPSRISCKVTSFNDSKTILDQAGAEKLLDKGDMLYAPVGKPKPVRVQGAFVSDGEVEKIMKFLKSNVKGAIYDEQAMEDITRAAQKCNKGKDSGIDDDFDTDSDGDSGSGYLNDKQFLEAADLAVKQGKISTSLIQRKIGVGYGKAAKFIDIMEELGIVSEPNGQKPRDVLVTRDEWREMLSRRSLDD